MKKSLTVALVCINAALLLALVLGVGTAKAKAQGILGATTDYIVITGHISRENDAVYVIDLKQRGMVAFEFNKTRKRLEPFRGVRKLLTDFRREKPR